jgi:hypothetical protein
MIDVMHWFLPFVGDREKAIEKIDFVDVIVEIGVLVGIGFFEIRPIGSRCCPDMRNKARSSPARGKNLETKCHSNRFDYLRTRVNEPASTRPERACVCKRSWL